MKDLVSIVTPTYNCGRFIAETIESVINQTYKNWEMIIVDDCSTDDTQLIVSKYLRLDKRIKYTCLDQNSGAAVARSFAMQMATGKYMAFLDSDDIWLFNKLELQISYMKQNKIAFTCTDYEQVNENGEKINKVVRSIKKTNYNRLLLDCPVGNSSVVYDVEKMGKFVVPNIRKRNDDALWLQMLKKEKYIYGINEKTMLYRIRKGSISSNKLSLVKYHWQLYREIENLSVIRSVFHICYWGIVKIFKIK